MYIDNSEPTENVGQIHFSLEYDFHNTTLILKIMQVMQLGSNNWSATFLFFSSSLNPIKMVLHSTKHADHITSNYELEGGGRNNHKFN